MFCNLLLVVAVSAVAARGQSYQGGLRGAARDSSGAVVVGCELSLINEETNTTRAAVTNSEGEYAFTNVLPGLYTLSATRSGYKKYEVKNIRVGTQEFITLDVRLEVGQTTESVTISGEAVILESSNPSIATTLETRALQELPTPARNVFFLRFIATLFRQKGQHAEAGDLLLPLRRQFRRADQKGPDFFLGLDRELQDADFAQRDLDPADGARTDRGFLAERRHDL